ncbi:MAG: transposase [Bacteroidales bacterium]|jgi:IS5 family transposase|nr:transposase [Bacteroidales bacterium]
MLNQKHPLFILANKVAWNIFEEAFLPLYCKVNGRPAKPIQLMVGLLMLKHICNVSDENVIEQWSENNYCQYFCGETSFVPGVPCEASELVHFRKRIGESGIELILKESIRINGSDSEDDNVSIDTTVQEKILLFPQIQNYTRRLLISASK